jgi:ATP-dependent DNA ligase
MAWRFIEPNKPIRASEQFLDSMDERHAVDVKLDGWRTEIGKFNNQMHAVTRRDTAQKIPEDLLEKASSIMPEGMALDCEWLNPSRIKAINTRYGCNLPEICKLVVFDITWVNGKYAGTAKLKDRRSHPFYASLPNVGIKEITDCDHSILSMPTYNGNNPKAFYEILQNFWICEGVVGKRLTGTLKSPWYKVKYRE